MLDIKKYSNGKFFDSVNKQYIKSDRIREYIKKGEKIKVTLTTTGEDITRDVVARYSGKSGCMKYVGLLNTDGFTRWITKTIDKRINRMIEVMQLPTREQITELNAGIRTVDTKIQSLELMWNEKAAEQENGVAKEKPDSAFCFVGSGDDKAMADKVLYKESPDVKSKDDAEKQASRKKGEELGEKEKILSNLENSEIDNGTGTDILEGQANASNVAPPDAVADTGEPDQVEKTESVGKPEQAGAPEPPEQPKPVVEAEQTEEPEAEEKTNQAGESEPAEQPKPVVESKKAEKIEKKRHSVKKGRKRTPLKKVS